jgi:hypothetical protein
MERWSVQHRMAVLELFIKTESVTATHRCFRQQFQRSVAPSRNTLLLWVSKWRQERPVKDSKPQGRPFSARTPGSAVRVRDAILRSPRRSARRQALAVRLTNAAFAEFSTRICITIHTKSKLLRNSARGKSSGLCFRADSFLVSGTSPSPPARLTLQYQTTSSGAMLKAKFTKHILPIVMNTEFWIAFKESPRKCYNVLLQPFHRDCRTVLNDMVVTYKVSNSNNND